MPKYSQLNLISQRYPQQNCLKVYRALRLVICGRTREVDWLSFSQLDWDLLNGMTMREGLSGLVYHAWKEGQRPANIPISLFAKFGAIFLQNQQKFSYIQTELITRIAPALGEAGLKMIIMKGADLAGSLYPQTGLRPMVDLDCLVSQSALSPSTAVLSALGYVEDRNHMTLPWRGFQELHVVMRLPNTPQSIRLELHFTLLNARRDFFELNMEWFFSQTKPFYSNLLNENNTSHDSLLTFTASAQLLHLSLHLMMAHGIGGSDLLHFYDIHLLLERWGSQINWEELLAAARDMNLDYAIFAAVEGCAERFNTPVPPALAHPPSGRRVQPLKKFIESRNTPIPKTTLEYYLRELSDRPILSQIVVGLRFVFPKPEYMRWVYKIEPTWLWPLSYPLRWGIGIRDLFRMLTRRSKIK